MFAMPPHEHPALLSPSSSMWPRLLSRIAGKTDRAEPTLHYPRSKTFSKFWKPPAWLASKKDKKSATQSRTSRIHRLALRAKTLVTPHSSPRKEQPKNALIALASPTPSEISALSPPEVFDQPSLDPIVYTCMDASTSSVIRHGSSYVSTVPPQTIPGPATSTISLPSSEDSPLLMPSNQINMSDALTPGLFTERTPPLISVTSPRRLTSVGFLLRLAPTQALFPARSSRL